MTKETAVAEVPDVESPEPDDDAEPEPSDREPAPEAAEPEPDATPDEPPAPPVAPEPPKVVTRTRRRAATRPAGPPAATPEPEAGAVLVADQLDGAGANSHDLDEHATPALHVPFKKRGSRKR